ncbi:MAG TPA: glycosyltransferase [Candidatus Acidoferrum sp.]|nr:glycosyltransferase [Candidatus Acidoferrum sp.]
MKVLCVHNRYQQRGGEDAVVEAEVRLMEAHGHTVVRYERHNDELRERGALGAIGAGIETVWASRSLREVKALIAKEKPDVAHFHNTFPLVSPAAYYACAEAGVPVVQTLHNYRLPCPSATFLRDGKVCEACLGRSVAWPGVVHGCYRGSRPATAAVASMLTTHHAMRTWQRKVNVYIALSEFARRKFIEGGLPAERIVVKPNFLGGEFGPKRQRGEYALFVGRLSEEKGPQVLLSAWRGMQAKIPLRIAGDGPLLEKLSREVETSSLAPTELTGRRTPGEVRALMLGARFLVFPSIWYEGFPMTIAEAFACGLPVIASRRGSMTEIVQDGVTGLHFEAGNAADLAAKAEWAWNHLEELARMGRAARAVFKEKYGAGENYKQLIQIYEKALGLPIQESTRAAAAD